MSQKPPHARTSYSLDPDETGDFRKRTEQTFIELRKAIDDGNEDTGKVKKMVEEIKTSTDEIVKIFGSIKGGVRVLGWCGHGVKWLLIISAGAAAIKLGLVTWLGIGK